MNRTEDTVPEQLDEEQRSVLIEATHFFLLTQHIKGIIKDADLKRILSKLQSKQAQQEVFNRLNEYLKKLIGFQIVEVSDHRGKWLVAKDVLTYNKEIGDSYINFLGQKEKSKEGFLNAVLMFLYVAKSPSTECGVPEQDLLKFIDRIRPSLSEEIDDPKSLIRAIPQAEFVSQGWIQYKRTTHVDGNETVTYTWGPRAIATVDRMKLLQEFCKIDGSNPRIWKDHWEDARNSDTTTASADDNTLASEPEQGTSSK